MNNRIVNKKMIEKTKIYTPILLLIFNRPVSTQKVFNAVREVRPKKLFVAADGPREGVPTDLDKCLMGYFILMFICNHQMLNLSCILLSNVELHNYLLATNADIQYAIYAFLSYTCVSYIY